MPIRPLRCLPLREHEVVRSIICEAVYHHTFSTTYVENLHYCPEPFQIVIFRRDPSTVSISPAPA